MFVFRLTETDLKKLKIFSDQESKLSKEARKLVKLHRKQIKKAPAA